VTVCDNDYKILYMNDKAAEGASKEGGNALIGQNLMDCHPPEAQRRLREVMTSTLPHVYTVEKNRVKKMVYQCRWKGEGRVGGLVELYFEIPHKVPNRVRK
jgi:PAS domain-containing protein